MEIDIHAVKASTNMLALAQSYGIKLRRAGREYVGLSPFKPERTPSFYIDDRKGLFKDFASGEGGDCLRLVMLMEGLDFVDALKKLAGEAGIEADPAEKARRAEQWRAREATDAERRGHREMANIGYAASAWRQSVKADGTLVETYLRARGIDLDAFEYAYGYRIPQSLRFNGGLTHLAGGARSCGPAMIGVCGRHINGKQVFAGVHRTWLAADGSGKARLSPNKMTLGPMNGAATRLSGVGPVAVLGEGYETTLSVMARLAAHGEVVFGMSGLFLGNIAGAGLKASDAPRDEIAIEPDPQRPGVTMPEGVEEVILLKDADGKRPQDIERFMRRAATKFQRAGLRVRIASPEVGKDFNDMVMEEAA
ncbi:MAG: CHC2 zinc finger domain-containing protein [Pseudomonadota bacterium]|nr:CHC2 zinc finger domain-containing protein [Pseudomonadota bacterium]